jgi:hypothetical protein
MRITILHVLAAVALLGSAAFAAWLWWTDRPPKANVTLFHGGTIHTMASENTTPARFLVVAQGAIVYVGSDRARALSLAQAAADVDGQSYQSVDLQGGVLLPGFINAHTHVLLSALAAQMTAVDPDVCPTLADVVATLKKAATATAAASDPRAVVTAMGYDPSRMRDMKTADELDAATLDGQVSASVPVLVIHASGHVAYANTPMLALLDTKTDPPGGRYGRDAQGQLTGRLYELPAIMPAVAVAATRPPIVSVGLPKAMAAVMRRYARTGFTTLTDMTLGIALPTSAADNIELFRSCAQAADAPTRLQGYVVSSEVADIDAWRRYCNVDVQGRMRVLGMKVWADGSPQAETAAFREPYVGSDSTGTLNYSTAALTALLRQATADGHQVAIHTNGDAAVAQALDALQGAHVPTVARPRLEHATFTGVDLCQRALEAGVTPSFTASHVCTYPPVFARLLGPQRLDTLDMAAWFVRHGRPVSMNDDGPLAFYGALELAQTLATRHVHGDGTAPRADQKLTVREALLALTRWPAWQCGRERELGTLAVGLRADLVWLADDPLKTEADHLADIPVRGTWVEGRRIRTATAA